MKCSKYFGAKWHGFIKSESILAPKGASRFKTQNIRCDKSSDRQVSLSLMVLLTNFANANDPSQFDFAIKAEILSSLGFQVLLNI
jgi:hypothetical protein